MQDNNQYDLEQLEKKLIELINLFKGQTKVNRDYIQQSQSALIFIGSTGSGKSTLFNWLNGADYEYKNTDDDGGELRLKNEEGFSKIGSGTKSITLYPQYKYNKEHKHLTIDFPGFQDTRGWEEQLIIKLMLYDIFTTIETKLVVVLEHPVVEFQNRASSLQDLVKGTFKDDSEDFTSICLFLNKFSQKQQLNKVIFQVKKNLNDMERNTQVHLEKNIYKAFQQNIIVLEAIQDESDLKTILNKEKLTQTWASIKATPPRKITPKELEHSDKISNYLYDKSQQILFKITQHLKTNLYDKIKDKDQIQLQKILDDFNKFYGEISQIDDLENNGSKLYQQTIEFLKRILINMDSKLSLIQFEEEKFIEILTFFSDFKNQIKGFENSLQNFFTWLNVSRPQIQLIQQRIQILKEQEVAQRQIKEEMDKNNSLKQNNEQLKEKLSQNEIMFSKNQQQLENQLRNYQRDQQSLENQLRNQQKEKKNVINNWQNESIDTQTKISQQNKQISGLQNTITDLNYENERLYYLIKLKDKQISYCNQCIEFQKDEIKEWKELESKYEEYFDD